MRKTLTQTTVVNYLRYSMRVLIIVTCLLTLAVSVVEACGGRQIIYIGTTIYGGRQFDTFLSCGSSAGNFAYTCAEDGLCYENTTINADVACGCSNEDLTKQDSQ
jgi:hypothetical protein